VCGWASLKRGSINVYNNPDQHAQVEDALSLFLEIIAGRLCGGASCMRTVPSTLAHIALTDPMLNSAEYQQGLQGVSAVWGGLLCLGG